MFVASVNAVPKAPIAVAKAIAPEATKAGASAGSTTSRCTAHGLAPSERAASSRPISSFCTAAIMVRMTRGMEKYRYPRSEEHTSELQSQSNLVCRLLLEKKKKLL